MLLLSLTLLLAGCGIPAVQDAAESAISSIGRGEDGAILAVTDEFVLFDPYGEPAFGVVLFVDGVTVSGPPEGCVPRVDGWSCYLGDISQSVVLPVTGTRLVANVSYYRRLETGETVFRFFYVRQTD